MTPLEQLIRKKEKLVIGLMSGTSADSVDAALVEMRGNGTATRFSMIAFHSHPFPKGFRKYLLQNSLPGEGSVDTISTLNVLIAHLFADAVLALTKKSRIPLSKIDLIGSHGQTIHHLPQSRNLFGKKIRSTLQIGDPSTIAKLTGIVTVGNFRTGDMALGGQGAPLVPYFDFLAFRSQKKNRALLNIGGIANITVLKRNCSIDDVAACDTGPGNMVIDALTKHFYGKEYDRNGDIAAKGKIIPSLLRQLLSHPYFNAPLPKSTGRELFGGTFVKKILHLASGQRKKDVLATATEFTAVTIYEQFNRFLRGRLNGEPLHELIVSGGGAKNRAMIDSLKKYFHPTMIISTDDLGVSSDAKEAVCFALLANETIAGNPSNVSSVTGAKARTILGTICV